MKKKEKKNHLPYLCARFWEFWGDTHHHKQLSSHVQMKDRGGEHRSKVAGIPLLCLKKQKNNFPI